MSQEDRLLMARRAARIARIIERLEQLDEGTLEQVDRLTAAAVKGMEVQGQPQALSRRQFLGVAAGGAVVATIGGVLLWQRDMAQITALEDEVSTLRQIISLYEEMDGVGLDGRVEQGVATVGTLISGLESLGGSLSMAVETARDALLNFQSRFPSIQGGFRWLQGSLNILSQRILALENEIDQALGLTGSVEETAGSFLAQVLGALRARDAERFQGGLERLGEVISLLPTLIQGLYSRVIEPMDGWFSSDEEAGLNGWIINPLLDGVLTPTQNLVEQLSDLAETWEAELVTPVEDDLRRRRALREEIQGLRQ